MNQSGSDKRKSIDDLLAIMVALRDPDHGCPWDKQQDFASIAPYTIEEAYEVADAIQRNDLLDLEDELGDLLLQVVYHARIAEERDAFDFSDVVTGICRKMTRRHPHVFGDDQEKAAVDLAGLWDRVKAEEKKERDEERLRRHEASPSLYPAASQNDRTGSSYLDSIPRNLPPLSAATKLQARAAKVGFDWQSLTPVLDKLDEEVAELRSEIDRAPPNPSAIEDELGDVLFVIANIARHLNIDPNAALARTNAKFRDRFAHIEQELRTQDKQLEDATLDEMEHHWQNAKKRAD